ncbi:flagellar basal body-associated protein FliL [Thermodesulfatator indicus DSM 15286]|uniref:Flagellar protein FliL n=1 Tax=Thermodesulfatator indicus (strain DSM 15286 / JCM 11887 / CIR29812) TaxID=667014 RepID=F8A8V3_THEID|nr:flagellar basal body-associated FliL family protein [Thermodesulfatator indicus]AEH44000.1 flagellar basal body-associated protein FliL [Thermodesulfatator indicus DSM 15286]
MKKQYVYIALLLTILILGGLLVFGPTKIIFKNRAPSKEEIPSMLKALPFENKKPRPQKYEKLMASLKDNEIFIEKLIFSPKNAPRGTYVYFDLVIRFKEKKTAKKFKEAKDLLEHEMISRLSQWDWLDFQNADGLQLIKNDLLRYLQQKHGSQIASVYFIRFKIGKQKGL